MRRNALAGAAIVSVLAAATPAVSQWLNYPTAGIPRLPDGTPNLTAPAPRLPNGKPDLYGIWEPTPKYVRNLAADLKDDAVPMQAWAEAVYKDRLSGARSREEPDANCLPQGVPKIDAAPAPYKFINMPNGVAILYEAFTQWRQIFTDGRPAPVDPNPTWFGYSTGRWDGDALVVETTGFNGKVWLDQVGHPTTDALHVTERFTRKNLGQMELQITIDDPKAYTKPWTAVESLKLLVDSELLEFICHENNRDLEHLPGTATK
jgi:hypothetical protein